MKKFYNKVQIIAYYNLDGEYLIFECNELHNKTFSNVNVEIKTERRIVCGMTFEEDVICIDGEEPISCELVKTDIYNGTLILRICQDWG